MAKKKLADKVTVREVVRFLEGFDDDTEIVAFTATGEMDVASLTVITTRGEPDRIAIVARSED